MTHDENPTPGPADATDSADDAVNTEAVNEGVAPAAAGATPPAAGEGDADWAAFENAAVHPDTALAAERLADLQRLQAEYVNYKRRVDRDRALVQELEGSLGKYGLTRFGAVGEEFDPMQHEALMHAPWPADNPDLPTDATTTTVVTVLQPGYRTGDTVIRPARVAVADPQ